jgi:hypothetical protein
MLMLIHGCSYKEFVSKLTTNMAFISRRLICNCRGRRRLWREGWGRRRKGRREGWSHGPVHGQICPVFR